MSNWVDSVVASTIEAESPERFQYWSSLAAIAAVVKKSVFLDRFYYTLYPNIYVFLVAKSGLRKGNPIILAKKLVQETGATRVISGRGTIQAVLKELGKAHSSPTGIIVKNASGFMVSGELDSFISKDPSAMTILTDLYDTHANEPEWKNSTKTQGIDTLREPCLTLLGGTNEEHFDSAIAEKDIKGGFIARTIIVFESIRRCINDLMDPPKIVPIIPDLACYLKELAQVRGQFKLINGAREFYRPWYYDLSITPNQDKTGTVERLGDTVLKVAMLLSLAEDVSLEIHKHHIEEAIFKCEECLNGLKQITIGSGKSELGTFQAEVLKLFLRRPDHTWTRKQLLNRSLGDWDSITLDRIMQTLVEAGAVVADQRNKDVIYVMKSSVVENYSKFKKEIN